PGDRRRPAPPPRRRRRPGLRQPPALPAEGDRRRAAAVAPGPPQPRARRRVLRGRERRRSRAGLPAPQLPRRQSQARAAGGDDTLLRPVRLPHPAPRGGDPRGPGDRPDRPAPRPAGGQPLGSRHACRLPHPGVGVAATGTRPRRRGGRRLPGACRGRPVTLAAGRPLRGTAGGAPPARPARGGGAGWRPRAPARPGAPGVVAAVLLNPVPLQPGEAMYIPPGTLHAYLHGTGLEVMATSDNVLRAGLTPKKVDAEEVLQCMSVVAAPPVRVAP